MKIKPAANRIKELHSIGMKEYQIIATLRREGYDVSRRFVRDTMGTSTDRKYKISTGTASFNGGVSLSGSGPRIEYDAQYARESHPETRTGSEQPSAWDCIPNTAETRTARLDIPANAHLLPEKPLTLAMNTWAYATDFHAPLHSRKMVERLVLSSEHRGIDTLIIGGDLFDFDSISRHGRAERQAGLNVTLEIGGQILDLLSDHFKTIYILPGNHDRRAAAKLDEPLEFHYLVRAAVRRARVGEQIITTDYDYIYVGPEETGWVVGHPRAYRASAKGFAKIASIQHRNVIVSHTHQLSRAFSDCGRYLIIDPGCMADREITPYYQTTQGLSMYSVWKNGFVHVIDNTPYIMADGYVEWGKYGAA